MVQTRMTSRRARSTPRKPRHEEQGARKGVEEAIREPQQKEQPAEFVQVLGAEGERVPHLRRRGGIARIHGISSARPPKRRASGQ